VQARQHYNKMQKNVFKYLGPYLGPLSLQLLQELKYFKKFQKEKKIVQIFGEKN
jgi:hypothetical protein